MTARRGLGPFMPPGEPFCRKRFADYNTESQLRRNYRLGWMNRSFSDGHQGRVDRLQNRHFFCGRQVMLGRDPQFHVPFYLVPVWKIQRAGTDMF
jgi:hypothetical protein